MRRLLLPVSWLIYAASQIPKRWILARPLQTFAVPIIVVGNISLGGTGKTPFVCALVEELKKRGYSPGVVSRGYKGKYSSSMPHSVSESDLAENAGDEPLLISSKTKVPVVICKKRPKAVEHLLKYFPNVNIIISDDGLQHYRLHRDIEIALVKEDQSPLLFPAGYLREPLSRLKSVDFIVKSNRLNRILHTSLRLLNHANVVKPLHHFKGKQVYAVAGTANPDQFFEMLKTEGVGVIECSYSDHFSYKESDFKQLLAYAQEHPIIMTEKDAIKFKDWPFESLNIWVASLVTKLDPLLIDEIINRINKIK